MRSKRLEDGIQKVTVVTWLQTKVVGIQGWCSSCWLWEGSIEIRYLCPDTCAVVKTKRRMGRYQG